MKPDNSRILTINPGSSSIRFALYKTGEVLQRGLYGKVDRIGLSETNLTFYDPATNRRDSRKLAVSITNRPPVFCWTGSNSRKAWNR